MKRLTLTSRWVLLVLLFAVAFIPRAVQPVSRPLVWYLRSAYFAEAVLTGNWAYTVYSEHPGVGLMWPVGFALKAYWALSGVAPAAETVPPGFEPIHFFGPVPQAEIAAGVVALALLIALGIVGIYLMLHRLFGATTAATAGFLLAISPYFLTQSKVLHLDAWMATLMLLSGLALLLYRREGRSRWLLLSGAIGGLALLVKTPALFLLPFSGLVMLVDAVCTRRYNVRALLTGLVLPLVIWVLVAGTVFVALWPVMWVSPSDGIGAVVWGITRHAGSAHDSPTFFQGQVMREDPGPMFYAVALLHRSGEIELVFLVAAVVLGAAQFLRHRRLSPTGVDVLLLAGYAFFYLAQMSLGAKKMPRYIIPALLSLDVLAAAGIASWARRLAAGRHRTALALMAVPLLAQAALVLPRHPYYGTTFNLLMGGGPAAAKAILIGEEGEGLGILADYLNSKPDAQDLTVAAQLPHVLSQTFRGTTVDIDQPADYLVFHHNLTVRDYKVDEWGDLWERYAAREPEQKVQFDGVPYAWLYPVLGADTGPEHTSSVTLGSRLRFVGYDLRSAEAAAGARIPVVLYWQATQPVTQDLSVFLHLLGPTGELVWQDDGAAAHGSRPTWSWSAGELVADPHTLLLPDSMAEGDYVLTAGLYDWQTGDRLSAFDSQGERLTQDQVEVATLDVRSPEVLPAAWVARVVAALVLASVLVAARRSENR